LLTGIVKGGAGLPMSEVGALPNFCKKRWIGVKYRNAENREVRGFSKDINPIYKKLKLIY